VRKSTRFVRSVITPKVCAIRANDKFGRKRTIQVLLPSTSLVTRVSYVPPKIGSVIALWGCAMQAGAGNVATLLVGRIIGGLAIGYSA
jgi:MFS family permease